MKFIISEISVPHRYGGPKVQLVKGSDNYALTGEINGIRMIVCKDGDKFWLMPNSVDHHDKIDDIGPFNTPEQAYAQLRLRSE